MVNHEVWVPTVKESPHGLKIMCTNGTIVLLYFLNHGLKFKVAYPVVKDQSAQGVGRV